MGYWSAEKLGNWLVGRITTSLLRRSITPTLFLKSSWAVAWILATWIIAASASAKPITLAYQTPTLSANLPILTAMELGLFAAENLEVKTVFIQGGPTVMAALIGGDVDYVKVAGVPAARAVALGAPVVIAGGYQPYIDYSLLGSKKELPAPAASPSSQQSKVWHERDSYETGTIKSSMVSAIVRHGLTLWRSKKFKPHPFPSRKS